MTIPTTGHLTTPDGTDLAYRDHRPPPGQQAEPRPLLLLHGLAGHMGEWDDVTPLLLADGHRVVTYDARGHGASTRRPADMTRAAAVRDALTVIGELGLAPVILVGQSLGGHTALLTAAAHPDAVEALILIEAGPGGPNPELPAEIAGWLDSWPASFASPSAAADFFGHEAWSRNLEEHADGWHVRADRATTLAAVAELATHSYWDHWDEITCPALLVRGSKGTVPEAEAAEMRDRRPSVHVTTIDEAGHDVHLDRPQALHAAMHAFHAAHVTRVTHVTPRVTHGRG
ncbi:alpha/beta fold hydrolase [Streptomyces poonensis]|uniref:Peroxidase n=1 Tax=Streptomyces poonensis TaxID=68255 RepID=A0A918PTD6_9ACTN|nr:alpha/beta hydrolase [Streptomyces poonensis]GGZ22569.1 peroxidase [Streptomyces poonensis]GLJ91835.1 peroxidase [Streptomyces poonensis]